jgi:iron complex outermembrane receptor protein
MNFSNEIVLAGNFGPNGLSLTNNVEQSYRTGFEMFLNYKSETNWSISSSSSYNLSKITEQQIDFEPILSPRFISNLEVIYEFRSFVFAASARYQSSSYIDFANTIKLDDYVLINGRVAYSRRAFSVMLFMNNLSNSAYFNQGYVDFDGTPKFFVQAPINYNLAIQYNF